MRLQLSWIHTTSITLSVVKESMPGPLYCASKAQGGQRAARGRTEGPGCPEGCNIGAQRQTGPGHREERVPCALLCIVRAGERVNREGPRGTRNGQGKRQEKRKRHKLGRCCLIRARTMRTVHTFEYCLSSKSRTLDFFHKIGFFIVVVDEGRLFNCPLTIGCHFWEIFFFQIFVFFYQTVQCVG